MKLNTYKPDAELDVLEQGSSHGVKTLVNPPAAPSGGRTYQLEVTVICVLPQQSRVLTATALHKSLGCHKLRCHHSRFLGVIRSDVSVCIDQWRSCFNLLRLYLSWYWRLCCWLLAS
jgi:hypothetical protein